MKNIILFIIDSMNYSHMKGNRYLTPYFNRLREEGLSFENMYSQAPYTEAAVMNLYCGQSVLDNNGYIRRFADAPKTVFEAMQDKGYVTYFNAFQPQCFPSSLRRGVDHLYNNVGYDAGALWSYRLYLYADLFSQNRLTDKDFALLAEILEDNFAEWLRFLEELTTGHSSQNMICDNSTSYQPAEVRARVQREHESYLQDKTAYIKALLTQKTAHPLLNIPGFEQNRKIKNREFVSQVQQKYRPFFEKLDKLHKTMNRKNYERDFSVPIHKAGAFLKKPGGATAKEFAKSLLRIAGVFRDGDLFERIDGAYDAFKNSPSVKVHIDHYLDWETTRQGEAPSFACIHVDDIHSPEVFFTYDTEDMDLIDRELADAQDVLDNLPKGYYGNITHDLSLRYIDGKIQYLYEQLEAKGLLENTTVLICADHGFSFSGNPLRESFVINMYLENYNIPCVITGSGLTGKHEDLCCSKDIPAMLCYFADGNIPKEFTGKNVALERDAYDHLFIEYCGGGCPDLGKRQLKLGCFDKKYFVATNNVLSQPCTVEDITEVYDLSKDPLQKKNLKPQQVDPQQIQRLLSLINERKEAIASTVTN